MGCQKALPRLTVLILDVAPPRRQESPMPKKVRPVPKGFTTVTPHLTPKDAHAALAFYKKALGAKVLGKMLTPDGKVLHADVLIGGAHVFVSDPMMGSAPGSSSIHLYVENADKAWKKAVAAGAQVAMPLDNAFWGDRYGVLMDPFGQRWSIGSHVEDISPAEMKKRMKAAFAQRPQQ
jgi:PhnB protein